MQSSDQSRQMLESAEQLGSRVRANTPNHARVLLAWAAYLVVFIPGFDIFDDTYWGPVVLVAGITGGLLTSRYYGKRAPKVRPPRDLSPWMWLPWALFYIVATVIASVVHDDFGAAYTVAAFVSAVPLVVLALRQKRPIS